MKKTIFTPIFCFVVMMILVSGCGLKKKPVYPNKVDSAMEAAFQAAEQLYLKRQYSEALQAYQKFINAFPYNKLSDESYYKVGKIHFLENRWDEAINTLLTLGQKTPDPAYRAKAYLMAGYAAYKKEDSKQALGFLTRVDAEDLPTKLQLRHYSLMIFAGEKAGAPKEKRDYALLRLCDLYQESADPELEILSTGDLITKHEVLRRLDSWIISPLDVARIPAWFEDYPPGFSRAYIDYKWGKTYFEAGKMDQARKKLSRYIHVNPKHRYVDSAQAILKDLGGTLIETGEKMRVGVLLPLSGPHALFGQATLQGIKCAVGEVTGCYDALLKEKPGYVPPSFQGVELVVRDSGNSPEGIASLVDDLDREKVAAIIGPMSAPLAEAAAKRAQEIKIVLLPITQKSGLMQLGNYVFEMGYEANQQIHDLANQIQSHGLKRFGVFYPNSNYGQEMAALFVEEVKKMGGKIVARTSYSSSKTDLTDEVRRLKLSVTKFTESGTGVAFDALFIPDSYVNISRLVPALQAAGIDGIPLIGTNAWNDPQLSFELLGGYPGTFFLDIFYPGDNREIVNRFVSGFRTSFGKTPTNLEALGFDALWFVRKAALEGGSTKPSRIRESLLSIGNLEGVTGIHSFLENQGPMIRPYVLKAGEGGVQRAN